MNTAAKVRLRKEQRPEDYCPEPRCLWRTGGGYCPRHRTTSLAPVVPIPPVVAAPIATPAKPHPREERPVMTTPQAKRAVARALAFYGVVAELHARKPDWMGSDPRPIVFVRDPQPLVVADAVRSLLPGVNVILAVRGAA